MQDENQVASGQPEVKASGTEGDKEQVVAGGNEDKVNYSSYSKLLGEKKQRDAEVKELRERLDSFENEKLQSSGQKDELIQKLQNQLNDLSNRLTEKDQRFAHATLGSQVKTIAAQMGCQDPDGLLKLTDISGIPIDPETFTANNDTIKVLLEDQKKTRPYFFGKQAPTIQDVANSNEIRNEPAVDFTKMSRDELNDYLKKNGSAL